MTVHGTKKRKRSTSISEDTIQALSQALNMPLGSTCCQILAPNSEYYIREVIQLSKTFMRHSKRTHMLPDDLQRAIKSRERRYASPTGEEAFDTLYRDSSRRGETLLSLTDIYKQPIPQGKPEGDLSAEWLKERDSGSSLCLNFVKRLDSVFGDTDKSLLMAMFKELRGSLSVSALGHTINVLMYHTERSASLDENNNILYKAALLTAALLSKPCISIDYYTEPLVKLGLTQMLNRASCKNHWTIRRLAAHAIHEWATQTTDVRMRTRVTKTMAAALTDGDSPLGTIYGCLWGLAAMGRECFETVLLPLVKPLLCALEDCAQKAKEEGVDDIVEDEIRHICDALTEIGEMFEREDNT